MFDTDYHRVEQLLLANQRELPWFRFRTQRFLKRFFDLSVGSFLLVVSLPVMAITALAVKMTSPGPALFIQTRLKHGAKPFRMLKFRTMTDSPSHELKEVTGSDPRLTSIGAFLRASRLDELPQLVHVLRGEMSLVGPRPDVPQNLSRYTDSQLLRFAMPQGCTTWGVIRGGLLNDWSTRQDMNAEYVWKWSFGLDLKILIKTVYVLLAQKGTEPESAEN
ncbi:MAG TPA: sugar transferase [Phycisphaerales bacterium]|nr:sugar transferase [Phycisphaerales bacterium]